MEVNSSERRFPLPSEIADVPGAEGRPCTPTTRASSPKTMAGSGFYNATFPLT
jgi:hypothetical protein